MSEKDSKYPAAPPAPCPKWHSIASAIMELDMKLLELERQLGIKSQAASDQDSDSGVPPRGRQNTDD